MLARGTREHDTSYMCSIYLNPLNGAAGSAHSSSGPSGGILLLALALVAPACRPPGETQLVQHFLRRQLVLAHVLQQLRPLRVLFLLFLLGIAVLRKWSCCLVSSSSSWATGVSAAEGVSIAAANCSGQCAGDAAVLLSLTGILLTQLTQRS